MSVRRALFAAVAVGLLAGAWTFIERETPLPADLAGSLVFVSDRSGTPQLYLRRLPDGEDRRLTSIAEPARDPALSPDGRRVAFSYGGRIGAVELATGELTTLTLGVDWRDGAPSWRADGKALAVVARRGAAAPGDVHVLLLAEGGLVRRPVTDTPGHDESEPVFGPDGGSVVFVREDHLFRADLAAGRTRRLTGGFKTERSPRFLPSGRLVCLWSQGKRHGIDVLDADGGARETLWEGSVFYRGLDPSPDGRYFAATFVFDLGFHPAEALKLRQTEEVRLLDADGAPLAPLARSWRFANHSPDWGR